MNTRQLGMGAMTWVVAILVGLIGTLSASAQADDMIRLTVGQKHILNFDRDVQGANTDSSVVELRSYGERTLEIVGRASGQAAVNINYRDGGAEIYRVLVGKVNESLRAVNDFLTRQLKDVIGVQTMVNDELGIIEISGEVVAARDRDKLNEVLVQADKIFPGKIANLVQENIDDDLIRNGFVDIMAASGIQDPTAVINTRSGKVYLGGEAFSGDARDKAVDQVKRAMLSLGIEDTQVLDGIRISDALIEIEFTYFFFSDTLQEDIGADLMNNIGLQAAGSGTWTDGQTPTYQATVGIDLSKVLNFLADDGKVYARNVSTVRTRNGATGESGFGDTTIIIPRATGLGTQADYKEIKGGPRIKVTPLLKPDNKVELDLDVSLDSFGGYTGQGDATVRENQARTIVDVPLNHFAVIAVNQYEEVGEGNTGTPFLRQIPLVNLVFGRKSKVDRRGYTALAVVPRLAGTQVADASDIAEKTDEIIRQIKKRLEGGGGA